MMEDNNEREPTTQEIKECVRQALCRFLRDSLEWNDFQKQLGSTPETIKQTEEDIMEDFQLVLDYLRLINYNVNNGTKG